MRGKSQLISQCPMCSQKYEHERVRVLEQEGTTRLVHMTCEKCKLAVLALVVSSQAAVGSIGVMTDLTLGDVVRVRNKENITEDDILAFHALLAQHPVEWKKFLINKT